MTEGSHRLHGTLTFKIRLEQLARTRVLQRLNYFEPGSGVPSVVKG